MAESPVDNLENTYLSFSNPNYHYEDRKNSNNKLNKDVYHSESNIYDEIDVGTISLLDKSKEQNKKDMKLENTDIEKASVKKRLLSNDVNSSEEEVGMSTDEEVENKDKGKNEKVESENKKNLKNSDSGYEEIGNCKSSGDRKKQGFLGYYTMLEAKAKEKQLKILETPDTEEETDTPTHSNKYTKFGFDINSPDSNDSGIQSDARSDDGINHLHGPVNEDIYAVVCKSTSSDLGALSVDSNDSDDNTPTEEENNKKRKDSLPPGWEKCEDEDGPYYWHIKSGTIQREPPSPAPPDTKHVTIRSVSINSDSSTLSSGSDSVPSTPTSGTSDDPLLAFEGHALQYAVKSIQNMSSSQSTVPKVEPNLTEKKEEEKKEKAVRFSVRSLGWVRIAEEDLTPERSSRAVNKCIVDLTLGRNDINDVVGRWGDGKDLYLDLDRDSLRLVDTQDFIVINVQPIQSIRVWGVGRDNGRDFAYVARDKATRKHMCHVFRCDNPARQIANTLRDICKQLMMERRLQQANVDQRLSRPTDLPNLEKAGQSNQKAVIQSLLRSASFPTPMEEPKKVIRCHYIACEPVLKPVGTDILNGAIMAAYNKVPPEKWKFVSIAIAPSTITITEHKTEIKLDECRVRFLSFMGIAMENVRLCGFIIHGPEDQFNCHVFHCEPSAGALCKTIEAACKLRYQKLLDANPTTPTNNKMEGGNKILNLGATISAGLKSSAETVQTNIIPGLKAGAHTMQSGLKAGAQTMQTSVKNGIQGVQNVFSKIKTKVTKSES